MDFIDELRMLSKRIESLKDKINTEESTKMSFIMPFFQLLGYDVFNPHEVVPEFTADVGIKKGEKIDYAIIKNDKPVILVEAKWCGENLDKYDSQLFRYFGTSTAKFSILTNGILYRFYTDLDEQNKMDARPFLEFNMFDIKEPYVSELKKFHKENFDIENIYNTASELKYTNVVMKLLTAQMKAPSDAFVKYVLSEIYTGVKTASVIERFREIVRKAMNQFVNELMSERITSALKTNVEAPPEQQEPALIVQEKEKEPKIVTTEEELEAFFTVKMLVGDLIDKERLSYKDTESYFGILLDGNSWKWICRFKLENGKKTVFLPDTNKKPVAYQVTKLEEILGFKDKIHEIIKRYLKEK